MKRDASTVGGGSTLRFEVCIVGAGPVGLALAETLASSGIRVGVLESGGEKPDRRGESLSRGVTRGLPYPRLETARARALGGTSWKWLREAPHWSLDGGLRCRPLDDIDFEARTHVPLSGWPLKTDELAPWQAKAHALVGLGLPGCADQEGNLPLDGSVVETTVSQFADSNAFRPLSDSLALRENADVVLGASVLSVETDAESTRIARLRVGTDSGWFCVEAQHFVFAGGGIENARLLLASPVGRPGGVANRFDQVGRHFMEHLHIESGHLVPGGPGRVEDLVAGYRRHLRDGRKEIRGLRISDEVQRREGLLNTITEFFPRRNEFTGRGLRSLAELAWGVNARSLPEDKFGHLRNVLSEPHRVARATLLRLSDRHADDPEVASLVMTAEHAPNPASRVTLARRKDRFGVPVPRLEWELTPLDYHNICGTQEVLDAQLRAAGIGHIEDMWDDTSPNPRIHGCWHHIGTTRMSDDARTGVVDSNCRVHGVENLWMAGSSVMPTAGAATVTLTAVALALRLAKTLAYQ